MTYKQLFSIKKNLIKSLLFIFIFILASLGACAVNRSNVTQIGTQGFYVEKTTDFPGGFQRYSWGTAQSSATVSNVELAQWAIGMDRTERDWSILQPSDSRAAPQLISLQYYYPLHVRWKLKDGRQFIIENIDIYLIMNNYFKSNKILLGWQRENRPRSPSGDGGSILTHEIKDDKVIIKWFIDINRTPVAERFTSTGAATKWNMIREEYHVITIDGKQTSSINFDKRLEIYK